jgi:hypothetical protein
MKKGELFKLTFGKRRKGKASKRNEPKNKTVSKYKGQGR